MKKLSKVDQVRAKLELMGDVLSDREISKSVGCSESFVYKVRNNKYYTPVTAKKKRASQVAKEQAIARNAELGMKNKKRGRPAKTSVAIKTQAVEKKEVTIREAIDKMLELVASKKDLFVSFDSKRYLVEMMWNDEVYQVPPAEVEQTLSAMKYLEDRELKWRVE